MATLLTRKEYEWQKIVYDTEAAERVANAGKDFEQIKEWLGVDALTSKPLEFSIRSPEKILRDMQRCFDMIKLYENLILAYAPHCVYMGLKIRDDKIQYLFGCLEELVISGYTEDVVLPLPIDEQPPSGKFGKIGGHNEA